VESNDGAMDSTGFAELGKCIKDHCF
jgi:hypothetical protein